MTEYAPVPNLDWAKLIRLLRATYAHGDGGLSVDSGIDEAVLSRCARRGVHSLDNGVDLWNLAIKRLKFSEIKGCVLSKPEGAAKKTRKT